LILLKNLELIFAICWSSVTLISYETFTSATNSQAKQRSPASSD